MNILTKRNGIALVAVLAILLVLTLLLPLMFSMSENAMATAMTGSDEQRASYLARTMIEFSVGAFQGIYDDAEEDEDKGIEVVVIDAEELLLAKAAWNTLMSAELCNNVSRYDGIKYGYRAKEYNDIDELYTNSRTESFGYLTKSTILYGSETLSDDNYMKVYDKALRIRRVLSEYMYKTFEEFDAIIAPVCSKRSYQADEAKNNPYIAYDESAFTAPASITGMPAVAAGGVQIIGAPLFDKALLDLAAIIK